MACFSLVRVCVCIWCLQCGSYPAASKSPRTPLDQPPAHDAWHKSIIPGCPRLNNALGTLALLLHGYFDYDKLQKIHLAHHAHHGDPHHDPDLPSASIQPSGPLHGVRWFASMATTYATPQQALCLAAHLTACMCVLHVPPRHVLLFIVGPFVGSLVRLFFFLTYLPHNMEAHAGEMPEGPSGGRCNVAHNTRRHATQTRTTKPHDNSNNHAAHIATFVGPRWLALWTSFHAVYHAQHHWWPWLPWWRLGEVASEWGGSW